MLADLHVHTAASDGVLTPAAVVALAAQKGLAAIGLTDHDTVEGVAPAVAAGNLAGVAVIPGIELSAEHAGESVHILGYCLDCGDSKLLAELRRFQAARADRVQRIVATLRRLGYDVSEQAVFRLARGEAAGRPHVARALMAKGYFGSVEAAFDQLLQRGRPGYVPRLKVDPVAAIALIRAAGGVAVLAHPGLGAGDELIGSLAQAGLQGLEAAYPLHTAQQEQHYRELARALGLIPTGGSDFHGLVDSEHADLGAATVGAAEVAALVALAGRP